MDSINQWFINPIKDQYFDFEGRSTVQQYWMFTLWSFIFSIVLGIFVKEVASTLFSLIILFPSLGIGVRRMHDIGKSGWWLLLWFIPIIGWIIMIVFLVRQGDQGPNIYGSNPKSSVASIPVPVPPTVPIAPSVAAESSIKEEVPVDNNLK